MAQITKGDPVVYTADWIRQNGGDPNLSKRRGKVTHVLLHDDYCLASILWDDGKVSRVLTCNLSRVAPAGILDLEGE